MTPAEMVREFHEAFGCAINERTRAVVDQRRHLLKEEADELDIELRLWGRGISMPHIAKELADLAYVAYGAALALGIDLDRALELVHASNMSKLDEDGKPILRHDGKVLKGPNYFEPDMRPAVMSEAA